MNNSGDDVKNLTSIVSNNSGSGYVQNNTGGNMSLGNTTSSSKVVNQIFKIRLIQAVVFTTKACTGNKSMPTNSGNMTSDSNSIMPSNKILNYSIVKQWGSFGTSNGQFDSPTGIAIDQSANVYVADYYNSRIQKFDSNGNFLTKWNTTGSYDQRNDSKGISLVDSSGNVYVANTGIQKFDSDGHEIKWEPTGLDEPLNYPSGISVDRIGNVYVLDAWNNRIEKFDRNGTFITKWGSFGQSNGQFENPLGIVILISNVYVADIVDNRIQKFDSNGNFLTKWDTTGQSNGQNRIAVDSSGNVYTIDMYHNYIQKFDSNGNFLTKWNTTGSDENQFNEYQGIVVDSSGNVYVADSGNNHIQIFSPSVHS